MKLEFYVIGGIQQIDGDVSLHLLERERELLLQKLQF